MTIEQGAVGGVGDEVGAMLAPGAAAHKLAQQKSTGVFVYNDGSQCWLINMTGNPAALEHAWRLAASLAAGDMNKGFIQSGVIQLVGGSQPYVAPPGNAYSLGPCNGAFAKYAAQAYGYGVPPQSMRTQLGQYEHQWRRFWNTAGVSGVPHADIVRGLSATDLVDYTIARRRVDVGHSVGGVAVRGDLENVARVIGAASQVAQRLGERLPDGSLVPRQVGGVWQTTLPAQWGERLGMSVGRGPRTKHVIVANSMAAIARLIERYIAMFGPVRLGRIRMVGGRYYWAVPKPWADALAARRRAVHGVGQSVGQDDPSGDTSSILCGDNQHIEFTPFPTCVDDQLPGLPEPQHHCGPEQEWDEENQDCFCIDRSKIVGLDGCFTPADLKNGGGGGSGGGGTTPAGGGGSGGGGTTSTTPPVATVGSSFMDKVKEYKVEIIGGAVALAAVGTGIYFAKHHKKHRKH